MTKILLIRHALTDAVGKNLSGRLPGVHLNDEGLNQSEKLAERLSHINIHAVYSSPLERAIETATPLASKHGLDCITDECFLELNTGTWTNKAFAEIKADPVFEQFNSFRSATRIPGGELMLEAQTRIITGLQKIKTEHPSKTVAVISHSDLIKAAVAYYAGIHLDMILRLEIYPASVSIIELFDETVRVLRINDTGEILV